MKLPKICSTCGQTDDPYRFRRVFKARQLSLGDIVYYRNYSEKGNLTLVGPLKVAQNSKGSKMQAAKLQTTDMRRVKIDDKNVFENKYDLLPAELLRDNVLSIPRMFDGRFRWWQIWKLLGRKGCKHLKKAAAEAKADKLSELE